MAGMKYSTGTKFNFSVAAGVAEVIRLRVGKAGQLDELNISGAAFRFYCETETGLVSVPVEHGASVGELYLSMPKFEAGEYSYTLEFSDSVGEVGVLLHGVLTVMGEVRVSQVVNDANKAEQRVLEVTAGSLHGGPLELRWCASSVAAKYAEQARKAALALEDVQKAVREFRVFVASWLDNMETFLVMNPETGTIWVNGYDTGQPYQGEPGKAPRVNSEGFWETWEDGRWKVLPYKAEGKDGQDGWMLRRVMLQPGEELPSEEVLGVMYYKPLETGGWDRYLWFEGLGWLNVGADPYGVAGLEHLGLVQLSTSLKVNDGAPVGVNDRQQLRVPMATTSVAGAMKPSSEVSERGGGTHFNACGNLLTDVATYDAFGSVRPSESGVLTEGGAIGLTSDGRMLVKKATTGNYGAIKLGTSYPTDPGDGFRVGIGEYRGEICLAFVPRGAMRHLKPEAWTATGMDWVKDVSWPSADSYYTCILTTKQFTQTAESGLALLSADRTGGLCGGVYLTGDVNDEGPAVVLTAQQVREFFALKSDAAMRDEVVLKSEPWLKGVVLTEEEYNALGDQVDPDMTYILI